MENEQEVSRLELLCKQLYESTDSNLRSEAEKTLINFQNSSNSLSKCQLLLERGDSSYSQLLAATTLTKLVSKPTSNLSLQERIDIRNYVLNYLWTNPKLPGFVIQALVTLFVRVTKLGWFDCEKECRNVIHDVTRFLQSSTEHCMVGVQLLSILTSEMNEIPETDVNRSITKHRRISSSFRDSHLYKIFQLSCTLLRSALENCKSFNFSDQSQHGLMTQMLRLARNCLMFNFIGTATDESGEDLCTVQIPTSWRPAFLSFNTMQLFFDLYHSLPATLSPLALSCLVQIASVRRSLFNNDERVKFLNQLTAEVKKILQNPQGLTDPNSYHEFCRLLARLKSNYQLGELVIVDEYPQFIRLVANFTTESLQMWQFSPNSVHYLLSLWQRMVGSIPYVQETEPHLLETYTPEVTKAYIRTRLESVTIVMRDGLEDPLEDLALVGQQLEQISTISRCEYEKTCQLLVQLFDQTAQRYHEQSTQLETAIQEGQLTWLVYIIKAAVGGRLSLNSAAEHDAMDGELICRVLQLMQLTDSRLDQGGSQKLELAMLSFFDQFRKSYVGDEIHRTSKVYRRLSDILGLNDESMVLSVFIRKIITNLKYWGRSEQIMSKTLQLLNDLSLGYISVRKLLKLEEVQFMLNNHTSEHFSFLGNGITVSGMRLRTTFYISLGRLLMGDLGEDEEKFEEFLSPLTAAFESVGPLLTNEEPGVFTSRHEEAKKMLIGLARDLRGIAFAFNAKTSYVMLFDWIYPVYTPILIRALELWYHDPQVTTPILKLFAELVQNRSQRVQFDVSSPNGILLFRETSKVICTYGSRLLTHGTADIPQEQLYSLKLKGVSICFSMLKASLCGSYVNFGVFRLYGDQALNDALQTFVKLLLSIRQSDLLIYPKLSLTYYGLLECLAQDHMSFLASLEPHVFMYILSSISDGLAALGVQPDPYTDTMVCTGCCTTLDHIVTYLFKQLALKGKKHRSRNSVVSNQPPNNSAFLTILELQPEILQQMLSTLLDIIMWEECRNQWSMSRPLLPLILLNEEYFGQLRETIIRQQPPEKQATIAKWFTNLMEGIERNLLARNRDRFTQNLSVFRREISESLKGPNVVNSSSSDMMT